MKVTAEMVKELREKTGAGIMDCKEALAESSGDMEEAVEYLRKKGLSEAAKRSDHTAKEGVVASYIHPGNKLGVIVEVNSETDFVAKTDEFKRLARDIAMQIAATNPLAIRREELPEEAVEKEKRVYEAQARQQGKPEKIIGKIVEGKLEKYFQQVCLLEQPFIKDSKINISELLAQFASKVNENISVKRFTRYSLGE